MIRHYNCAVVANGSFPTSQTVLKLLHGATTVIACDGATASLHRMGIVPEAIVGDMDSLPQELRSLYASRICRISEQESNDLTKAVRFARANGHNEVLIMGATGLREDHTLGNISLLLDYASLLESVEMISDYGLFTPLLRSATLESYRGQQVSIFTPSHGVRVTTSGLRWPIDGRCLRSWWDGTLNEALGESFTVNLSVEGEEREGGGLIIYRQLP